MDILPNARRQSHRHSFRLMNEGKFKRFSLRVTSEAVKLIEQAKESTIKAITGLDEVQEFERVPYLLKIGPLSSYYFILCEMLFPHKVSSISI